jgi:hypothetical protein
VNGELQVVCTTVEWYVFIGQINLCRLIGKSMELTQLLSVRVSRWKFLSARVSRRN